MTTASSMKKSDSLNIMYYLSVSVLFYFWHVTDRYVSQKAIAAISNPATVIEAGMRSPITPNTSTIDGTDSSIPSGNHTKKGSAKKIPTAPITRRARRTFLRSDIGIPVDSSSQSINASFHKIPTPGSDRPNSLIIAQKRPNIPDFLALSGPSSRSLLSLQSTRDSN